VEDKWGSEMELLLRLRIALLKRRGMKEVEETNKP
jgi:hypothetical protein